MVEVMVGKRTLGEGRGHNKKEAEQAAARDALEKVERVRRAVRDDDDDDRDDAAGEERARTREPQRERSPRGEPAPRGRGRAPASLPALDPERPAPEAEEDDDEDSPASRRRRRSRRGGRGRHAGSREGDSARPARPPADDAPESEESDEDAFTRAVRAETRELAGEFEDEDDVESPRLTRKSEPAARAPLPALHAEGAAPAPPQRPSAAEAGPDVERARSFGRGRRRDSPSGAIGGESASDPENAETRRVDPYGQPEPPAQASHPA